jgi:hypothetical protein
VRALLLVIALAGISQADPVPLPDTKAQLDVPASWTALPTHRDLVAAYKSPTGHVLAVTRAKVPNVSAWIKDSREAYAVEIERGALAAAPDQVKVSRKISEVNGMPAFDLELRRPGGITIVLRVVLFRSYALAATIEVPKGGDVEVARAILARFAPPKPKDPPRP